MKPGKLSQPFWRRFVLKQFYREQGGTAIFAPEQEACMTVFPSAGQAVLTVSASASAGGSSVGLYALAKAVNELEIRGAHCRSVTVQAMLPLSAKEEDLQAIIAQLGQICCRNGIQLTGIQVTGDPAVRSCLVQVTAAGVIEEAGVSAAEKITPGQEIILCGYAGLEGSLQILDESEAELQKHFVPIFLQQFASLKNHILQIELIRAIHQYGVAQLWQIGSGGIFATFWEMAEKSSVGLEINMDNINIRQETVEICEYYRLNPYRMTSTGSFLIISDRAEELAAFLERQGIRAGRLGVATAGNARVIASGNEKRYLDRPAPDEVTVWHAHKYKI